MMGLSWLEWDMEFLVGHDFGIHLRYRKLFIGSITVEGLCQGSILDWEGDLIASFGENNTPMYIQIPVQRIEG